MKSRFETLRDEKAKIAYPPIHPAFVGSHNEAFKDGWDYCETEMQKELDAARAEISELKKSLDFSSNRETLRALSGVIADLRAQIKDYEIALEKISQGPAIPLIKMSKTELLDFIARFAQSKAKEILNKWNIR